MGDGREGGYIRAYRSVESSPDFAGLRADQSWVALRIVQLANWKPGTFTVERGNHRHVVQVGRGELAMSEETIAKRSKVGRQVVRTTILLLVRSGFLCLKSTQPLGQPLRRPLRILTVVNYDRFNPPEENSTNQSTNHLNSRQPVANQSLTRIEEGEEGEEEKLLRETALPLTLAVRAKKRKPETDPRFAPLRAAFEGEFSLATGEQYRWQGAKDAQAVHQLIAIPIEEFRAKAKAGLRAAGYARCATVAALAAKWNDLAAAGANGTGPPAKAPNPRAMMPSGTNWDEKPW